MGQPRRVGVGQAFEFIDRHGGEQIGEGGADGIHLYAMNDAAVAAKVYDGIRDLL